MKTPNQKKEERKDLPIDAFGDYEFGHGINLYFCKYCMCMTKTINGKCGKCKEFRP